MTKHRTGFFAKCFGFFKQHKIVIFHKEKINTFTPLVIFLVKSLQKEKNSTSTKVDIILEQF